MRISVTAWCHFLSKWPAKNPYSCHGCQSFVIACLLFYYNLASLYIAPDIYFTLFEKILNRAWLAHLRADYGPPLTQNKKRAQQICLFSTYAIGWCNVTVGQCRPKLIDTNRRLSLSLLSKAGAVKATIERRHATRRYFGIVLLKPTKRSAEKRMAKTAFSGACANKLPLRDTRRLFAWKFQIIRAGAVRTQLFYRELN